MKIRLLLSISALEICNDRNCPNYGLIHLNLGISYNLLGEIENKTENFQKARNSYLIALNYYPKENDKYLYANIQLNYAAVADSYINKVYAYHEAQSMFIPELYQVEYALTQQVFWFPN